MIVGLSHLIEIKSIVFNNSIAVHFYDRLSYDVKKQKPSHGRDLRRTRKGPFFRTSCGSVA